MPLSSRVAAVTGLDWAVTRWLSFGVQYEIEGNRLERGERQLTAPSRADQERLRFPTVMRDLRSMPTTSTGEPLEARPINGVKVSGNVNGYVPLTSRVVLALSLRAGTIVPLKEDTWVIGSKRFYLGGSSSLRAWASTWTRTRRSTSRSCSSTSASAPSDTSNPAK